MKRAVEVVSPYKALGPALPNHPMIAVFLPALALLFLPLTARAAETRIYELPAGTAEQMLPQFARYSGVQVVFVSSTVAGTRTRPVNGRFTAQEALLRMLADSGLTAVWDSELKAFSVGRAPSPPASRPESSPKPTQSTMNKTEHSHRATPRPTLETAPRRRGFSLLAALSAFTTAAVAQSVPGSEPSRATDEVIVLSPFTVNESTNVGYLATQTMAGSRLNTNLRDIGSSISVITPEFLADVGATDAQDLLIYTANTEVGGIGGNFAGGSTDFNGVIRNPERATRVRGLTAADLGRNFYLTDIPFDTYNTERVEIARGANAILFGLGSPAGIVNNSTLMPKFDNSGRIQVNFDNFGSFRGSFRSNRELLDDRLAIVVAGVKERKEYEQEPAFQSADRIYAALEWRITPTTSLTGNWERGTTESNRPRPGPVLDYITPWYDYGRPIWDTVQQSRQPPPLGRNNGLHGTTASFLFGAGNIFLDPNSPIPAVGGHGLLNPATTAGKGALLLGSFLPLDVLAIRYGVGQPLVTDESGKVVPPFGPEAPYYIQPSLTDTEVFNFRRTLLDGPNSGQASDFDALNLTLQQLFLNGDAGVELAYDRQTYDTSSFSAFQGERDYALYLDFNRELLDGRPNPGFGGVTTYATPTGTSTVSDRDALRATAFYKFNFDKVIKNERWAAALGRLVVTGLFNRQEIHREDYTYRDVPDPIVATLQPAVRNNSNLWLTPYSRVLPVSGLSPGQTLVDLKKSELPRVQVGGLTQRQYVQGAGTYNFWNQATQRFELREIPVYTQFDHPELAATAGQKSKDEIDSLAAVAQTYLLADHLVGTIGWRRDSLDAFDAGSAPPNATFFNHRVALANPGWVIPRNPTLSAQEDVWSYSGVLHVPDSWMRKLPLAPGLSVHFSKSSNFQPTGRRIDIANQPIGSPTGETTEMGFTVTLLDRKLHAKLNWYETAQQNNGGAGLGELVQLSRILRQSLESINAPENAVFTIADLPVPPDSFLEVMGFEYDYANFTARESRSSQLSGSSDLVSDGMEAEIVYNATPNLSFLLNVGRQKASRSNTSPATARLIEEFVIPELIEGRVADLLVTAIPNRPTVREFVQAEVINPFRLVRLQDGGPVRELKEWQVTFVGNYRFGAIGPAWLKGWSVGGAVRWLDESAIGFPVVYNDELGEYIQDVQNPHFGPRDTKIDAWLGYERRLSDGRRWSTQLNLRNVLNDDALIPIATQPDGSIARVAVPQPFTWEVTTTLHF